MLFEIVAIRTLKMWTFITDISTQIMKKFWQCVCNIYNTYTVLFINKYRESSSYMDFQNILNNWRLEDNAKDQ